MDGERDACLHLVAFAVSFAVSFIMECNDFMVEQSSGQSGEERKDRQTGGQQRASNALSTSEKGRATTVGDDGG